MAHAVAAGERKPLRLWILQTGEPLHVDRAIPRPMRAMNAADTFVARGHFVAVWSTLFYHQEKRHRSVGQGPHKLTPQLEYRLLPSPGYRRNVGVGRLWDHARLAANLRRALSGVAPPDACLIGYPPIEAAWVMVDWLRRRGVPALLDVKDQWPDVFLESLPTYSRTLGRIALWPYYRMARRTMAAATGICAMSESYLSWSLRFARRTRRPTDLIVPLTGPPVRLDRAQADAARAWWEDLGIGADDRGRFCFVGSHTRSFDFEPVAGAAALLASSHPRAEIVICGDGEQSSKWREVARGLPNVIFPGWIDQARYQALAKRCVGFIAPYLDSPGFHLNIPNKIVDALGSGLPIVTPLGGEVGALINAHGVGLRYERGSARSLHTCLCRLLDDPSLRSRQSAMALKLFQERFGFEAGYRALADHMEWLAKTANPS